MGYDVVDIDTLEGEGPGGAVRKLRRALGARAFGFNHFRLPPGITAASTTTPSKARRRSTSCSPARASCASTATRSSCAPGIVLRVDPATTRVPVAGDEGLEFITFGAPLEGPYEPPEWG